MDLTRCSRRARERLRRLPVPGDPGGLRHFAAIFGHATVIRRGGFRAHVGPRGQGAPSDVPCRPARARRTEGCQPCITCVYPRETCIDTEGAPMANPVQFIQQTRAEISKIVWPSRREVLLTTVTVFVMAALTATFFALVDILIRSGLQGLLTFFG